MDKLRFRSMEKAKARVQRLYDFANMPSKIDMHIKNEKGEKSNVWKKVKD